MSAHDNTLADAGGAHGHDDHHGHHDHEDDGFHISFGATRPVSCCRWY